MIGWFSVKVHPVVVMALTNVTHKVALQVTFADIAIALEIPTVPLDPAAVQAFVKPVLLSGYVTPSTKMMPFWLDTLQAPPDTQGSDIFCSVVEIVLP